MANYLTTDTELTSIANAIRTKGGTNSQLTFPTGFVTAINNISTGGGAAEVAADLYAANTGNKAQFTLDNNGQYNETNQDIEGDLYSYIISSVGSGCYCMVANSNGNVIWKGELMDVSYTTDSGAYVNDKTGGGVVCDARYTTMIEYQPSEPDPETGEPMPDTEISYTLYESWIQTNPIAAKVYLSSVAF